MSCRMCVISSLPPGVVKHITGFAGEEEDSSVSHISNLHSHSLTYVPNQTKSCTFHCQHMTCDLCCLHMLSPEGLCRLIQFCEKNRTEAEAETEAKAEPVVPRRRRKGGKEKVKQRGGRAAWKREQCLRKRGDW